MIVFEFVCFNFGFKFEAGKDWYMKEQGVRLAIGFKEGNGPALNIEYKKQILAGNLKAKYQLHIYPPKCATFIWKEFNNGRRTEKT